MKAALVALAFAQLADLATTYYAMRHGGAEANPIMAAALAAGGIALLAYLKLCVVAGAGYVAWLAKLARVERVADVVIRGAAIVTVLVAGSNLAVGGLF